MKQSSLKQATLSVLTRDPMVRLLRPLRRGAPSIFMLHRFAHPETGVPGHSPALLRAALEFLRRHRYPLLSTSDLIARLRDGEPPPPEGVAFTVDDGYADFAHVAAPIFAEYDCPVTVFLVTGVLDRRSWFWWDQVAFVFEHTRRPAPDVHAGGQRARRYALDADRARAAGEAARALTLVSDADKAAAIVRLAADAEVELPEHPPERFASMSWGEVQRCARAGATFGPHTVTHPILSRVGDAESEFEVSESWRRLREATDAHVPVFCYPNGDRASFGDRERRAVQRLGLIGAVTTVEQYATRQELERGGPLAPYAVPRFPFPETLPHFVQVVSGLERAKIAARGLLRRGAASA